MRPSNGGLAQVAASLWLLRKAQPLRVLAKTIDYASTSTSPPCRRATRDRGEVEDGPQHLNKSPLMFICESLTMDDVEAGAGNPVCGARLA